MELSALHHAVRRLARGGEIGELESVSAAERKALRALQRRLQRVGGEIARLAPPSNPPVWAVTPQTEPAR